MSGSWSAKYRMEKGNETVGPCIEDLYWNGLSLVVAIVVYYTTFPLEQANQIALGWMLVVFARNFVLMGSIFQGFHYYLYVSSAKDSLVQLKFEKE